MRSKNISVMMPPELLERVETLIEPTRERYKNMFPVSRSTVIRMAVEKGVEAMEKDLKVVDIRTRRKKK